MHAAHAPATQLRRPARAHDFRLLLAVTRRRRSASGRPVGLQPLTQKGCPQCHPESVRLRRSPAAKRLATGSNDRKIGDVCRVSSRPSPRPTPGAVSDELTSSACGLIGFDDPGPQAVTGTYLRRAALDRLSAASSAQSTWATRRKTHRAVRPWGKRALVRFGCFRSAEQGAGVARNSWQIAPHRCASRAMPFVPRSVAVTLACSVQAVVKAFVREAL